MAEPTIPVINIDNVYHYNAKQKILTKQEQLGTYDANSEIAMSAVPRKRVETNGILSGQSAAIIAGLEQGAENDLQKIVKIAKHIGPTAKMAGAANDVHNLGQHVIQGNGAEVTTESLNVAGQAGGAWLGAEFGGVFVGSAYPPAAPIGAVIFGGIGAYIGGEKTKELATKLTGGEYPDLMTPPPYPPNNVDIQPTITTEKGRDYALVSMEGQYHWYGIVDNSNLMRPSRFVSIMSGQKIYELTDSYLKAAGFEAQVLDKINLVKIEADALKEQTARDIKLREEVAKQAEIETKINNIKQGKAPDNSELGKLAYDSSGASIWIHDVQNKRFVYVGTSNTELGAVSVETYFDEKNGSPLGGKIYVPDGKGSHKITTYKTERSPNNKHEDSIINGEETSTSHTDKMSLRVENLKMAYAFTTELPINAVKNHAPLAETYVAQAAFIQQIATMNISSAMKTTALNHFNDKAANNIAVGNIPKVQINSEPTNQVFQSEMDYDVES